MTESRVPAEPIRRLIDRWEEKHPDARAIMGPRLAGCLLGNTGIIASLVECPTAYIKDIRSGRCEFIPFDRADRIVTRLSDHGGFGWHMDAELALVYQQVDLSAVDAKSPTSTRAAA